MTSEEIIAFSIRQELYMLHIKCLNNNKTVVRKTSAVVLLSIHDRMASIKWKNWMEARKNVVCLKLNFILHLQLG